MLSPTLPTILILRNSMIALVYLTVLSTLALPLAGCSDEGPGGPGLSSLSTLIDTHPKKDAEADSASTEADENGQEDPTSAMTSAETEPLPSEGTEADPEPLEPLVVGLEGEEDPMIAAPSTPTDATARLNWTVHPDPAIAGYRVYYGKQSSGEPGSCSYESSQSVEAPPAIITGLEPYTPYFFAISAYGGDGDESESPCSNEVLVISSSAQG